MLDSYVKITPENKSRGSVFLTVELYVVMLKKMFAANNERLLSQFSIGEEIF